MMLQKLIAAHRRSTALDPGGRIPPLDGLRAFFVFSVVAFHLWQQSWLTPQIPLPGGSLGFNPYLRTGYIWVDGMLLLSAFLLFLPHARRREAGRPFQGQQGFFRRRFARIVPTYLLNLLLVFFLVALPEQRYQTAWQAIRDWLAHLTFTHPWFAFSSMNTPLNGVLWTLGVEVQFYLIFPLLARAYHRMPLCTYLGGLAVAFGFRAYAMAQPATEMYLNQLPNFMDVYMNGFVAAQVYARLERQRDDGVQRALMTALMAAALMGLAMLVRHQAATHSYEDLRNSQMGIRFTQSLLTALLLLGASLGFSGIRRLLGNRVTAFLAAISYQMYMVHQMVALRFKAWGFPPSPHQNPHMVGDLGWQVAYILSVLGTSLLLSAGLTYLVEQPLTRRLSPGPYRGKKA